MMTTLLPFNQVSIFCEPTQQMGLSVGVPLLAAGGLITEDGQAILTEAGQKIIPE